MAQRKATARWEGTLKEGGGTLSVESGAFEALPYTFKSRFEEGSGTNPEELIGAAHAGCFSMALSLALSEAGHDPESVDTEATVHLGSDDSGPAIKRVDLVTRARVPGMDEETFRRVAEGTRTGCPVSKALAAIEIRLDATLES
jgi:osmotically inducible protein OsmC